MPSRRCLALAFVGLVLARPATGDEMRPRPQHVTVIHRDQAAVPTMGPRYAPVTIDFFVDVSRSLTQHQILLELARRHPQRLRIVYRLVGTNKIVEAAMEAHTQGRFFEFLDVLREHPVRSSGSRDTESQINEQIKNVCTLAQVDFERVAAAWATARYVAILEHNDRYRRRRHPQRTAPVILLNGSAPAGTRSTLDLGQLETAYDAAYAAARSKLDEGVPLERLYELSLREVDDMLIKPMPISAGTLDGEEHPAHRGLLEHAPLVPDHPGGHAQGPDHAPVTIRFYCNFLSTPCTDLHNSLSELGNIYYPTEVRIVFHPMFPLDQELDKRADRLLMHRAARCADAEGAFWSFYDEAYRNYLYHKSRDMTPAKQLELIVDRIALDRERFEACMADPSLEQVVLAEVAEANALGITRSPTLVIGRRMYPGTKSLVELRNLVEQELLPGLLETLAPVMEQDPRLEPLPPG